MKFFIISLALFAVVQADVSHLNREYLPPLAQKFAAATASLSSGGSVGLAAPGSDSSSYQPAHLIPAELQVEAQVVPGSDESSYQPAHLIPAELQVEAQVVPGSDESSYQPAHLIPAELQVEAQVVPGSDESSYQPAQVEAQVVPGSDESSYQPAHLIPAELEAQVQIAQQVEQHVEAQVVPQAIGADTYTPEQFIPEQVRIAHENYIQSTNGIGEFNQETHVPVAIGGDTITPAHLTGSVAYSGVGAGAGVSYGSSSASSSLGSSGIDTQYAPNGGYVY